MPQKSKKIVKKIENCLMEAVKAGKNQSFLRKK